MALIGNWTGKNLELGRRRMGAKLAKLGRMEMKLKRLIYRVSTKKLPSLFFGNNSLKSSPNFKTVLDLQFWPSRSLGKLSKIKTVKHMEFSICWKKIKVSKNA